MADVLLSKIKSPGTGETITYHTNDTKVTPSISGWVLTDETRYRFTKANTSAFPGNPVQVSLYVNQSYEQEITFNYISNDGTYWYGSLTYDGITLSLTHRLLQVSNIDEEFTLERTLVTLGKNDFLAAAGAKVYKCTLIHSGGSTIVYHEQILTPTYYSSTIGPTSIIWYFKNTDPDISVNMYARIGTGSFVLKASNVAPDAQGALSFTSLSGSTAYNVDVYCVPVTAGLKINSEEATDTRTTTSTTKGWVYQGSSGDYYRSITYYGNNTVCKFAGITTTNTGAALESAYPAASEPLGRTGRSVNYNNDFPPLLCSYHYFEVEYV